MQDFPEGAPNLKVAVLTYYFAILFCPKLHENERIWTPRGVSGAALGSANDKVCLVYDTANASLPL